MAILSPSILAADPMNMGRDILKIQEAGGKWVHIDVMDGHFVPNHSFSPSIVSGARKVSELFLDVHLMITEPIRYVENYCKAPAEAVLPFLSKCDLVLVMTVEPGFGGQKFMADMMPKVAKLRQYINEIKPDCHLEVDGGVDLVTCKTCKESGADVLVAGSAFYKAADMAAFTKEIEA